MKIIAENEIALVEVPYKGTDNYPPGVHKHQWKRTPVAEQKARFEVHVYVEGYRPNKDVWLESTNKFDTLSEALTFYHEVRSALPVDQNAMLKLREVAEGNGWWGLSLEYMEVFEYTPDGGVYKWDRT